MPIHNADIARVVGELRLDVPRVLAEGGELPKIPGIGEDLAGKMREIAAGGSCQLLEKLRRRYPAGVTELLTLPGLGPKRVRALYEKGIHSLSLLGQARRGWLERKDVLNTRPLAELRPLLKALHRPDRARVFG